MAVVHQEVIPANVVQAQRAEQKSLVRRFAERYGVDADKLMVTLKSTAFRLDDGEVSNEQMMALLVVADAHGLNPFTREIFAFPSQKGIVPVVSVDGWAKLTNDHPQFNGWEFEQDDEKCTCTIYRKDRDHPTKITEYMLECKRPTKPWSSHPKRMLRHKALIQAARYAFSFSGIYDQDEAEAIVENQQEIDVTPRDELEVPEGTVSEKISPRKLRELCEGLQKAIENESAAEVCKLYEPLTSGQRLFLWDNLRSWEKSGIRKIQATPAYKLAQSGLDVPAWSVSALQAAKNPEAVEQVYEAIEAIYAEHDQEVPLDIQTIRQDRMTELGA